MCKLHFYCSFANSSEYEAAKLVRDGGEVLPKKPVGVDEQNGGNLAEAHPENDSEGEKLTGDLQ